MVRTTRTSSKPKENRGRPTYAYRDTTGLSIPLRNQRSKSSIALAGQFGAKGGDIAVTFQTDAFTHDNTKDHSHIRFDKNAQAVLTALVIARGLEPKEQLIVDSYVIETVYTFNSSSKYHPFEVTPFSLILSDGGSVASYQKATLAFNEEDWPAIMNNVVTGSFSIVEIGAPIAWNLWGQVYWNGSTVLTRHFQEVNFKSDITEIAKKYAKRLQAESAEGESSHPEIAVGDYISGYPGNQSITYTHKHRIVYHVEVNSHVKL